MGNKGYSTIPATLFECITFLTRALPIRSVPTFIELLIGAMLTQAGFVTEAWLAIHPLRSWSAYYKWLQQGKWSWVALGIQTARMVVALFPQPVWFLIFDDTLIYRSSKKAPGSGIYHQHGNKTNRPQYARGQCWVSMALAIGDGKKHAAVPLLSRLMRKGGNSSKLDAARTLLRVIASVFAGKKVFTLVDSWYMKWPYLGFVLDLGFQAIGQVRRDTALYGLPAPATGKRGRPRIYGNRFTADVVAALPEQRRWLFIHGKERWVRYRTAVCLARFMKGRAVRAVWLQYEDEIGVLSSQRLILSTWSDITTEEVFRFYARRWSVEDLFNQMKNRWGWREAWQQTRQVLHRWTQILSVAYALPQLLAIYCGEQVKPMLLLTPWRKEKQVTAGRVRLGLQSILRNVRIRDWWNPKCRKFQPDFDAEGHRYEAVVPQKLHYKGSKNTMELNNPPPP